MTDRVVRKCPKHRMAKAGACAVPGCDHFTGKSKFGVRRICGCCVDRLPPRESALYVVKAKMADKDDFLAFEDECIASAAALPDRKMRYSPDSIPRSNSPIRTKTNANPSAEDT